MQTKVANSQQFVCTACGFNMIGFYPKRCRFCGTTPDNFISVEECSAKYRVQSLPVNDKVTQLKSIPQLGYEHAAYQINTGDAVVLIDCPSSFDTTVMPMDYILFTHNDFLGASNLYRQQFGAQIWIHKHDAAHPNSRYFTFDHCFETGFQLSGIEAVHIGGHSPGFTIYFFEDILFICDYVETCDERLIWNSYGNRFKTKIAGQQIAHVLEERKLKTVCDVSRAWEYKVWKANFDELIKEK